MDTAETRAIDSRPRFIMMSGTYCAGKSFWTDQYLEYALGNDRTFARISFDGIVAQVSAETGKSPHEVMKDKPLYKLCGARMETALKEALAKGENIVLDNTNTTPCWRETILGWVNGAPHRYHKTAVCMQITKEEGEERFIKRNARQTHIPEEKRKPIEDFRSHYDYYHAQPLPSVAEGFDLVLEVPANQSRHAYQREMLYQGMQSALEK